MRLTISVIAAALCIMTSCKQDGQKLKTTSGYEYQTHKKGNGEKAKPGDFVEFTIKIMDNTGKIYQESNSDPLPTMQIPEEGTTLPPNPITDVLALSAIGDSVSLFIPKDSLQGQLPPGSDSITYIQYAMAVKSISGKEAYEAKAEAQRAKQAAEAELIKSRELEIEDFMKATNLSIDNNEADIKSTASGLKYIIHEEGTGTQAAAGDRVEVLYYGTLTDGKMFDNAFKRGRAFGFTLGKGEVIQGWDEGIALLKEGSKATLIIPSDMGYGDAGSPPNIPGGSTLYFYVELVNVAK